MYTQEVINIGANPNDGTGDPLRVAFDKINNNFTSLFTTFVNSTIAYTTGDDPGQIIFETPATTFTQGQFYIQAIDEGTPDSQSIIITAQINNALDDIKFTGYGTTFIGNALTGYDMEVFGGNVRILANPLTADNLTFNISSQIMWLNI